MKVQSFTHHYCLKVHVLFQKFLTKAQTLLKSKKKTIQTLAMPRIRGLYVNILTQSRMHKEIGLKTKLLRCLPYKMFHPKLWANHCLNFGPITFTFSKLINCAHASAWQWPKYTKVLVFCTPPCCSYCQHSTYFSVCSVHNFEGHHSVTMLSSLVLCTASIMYWCTKR